MALAAEILEQIEDLTGKDRLDRLREFRRDLIAQVREVEKRRTVLRTERDEKNKKVKDLFAVAREAREKRDAVNEDVKLNKALRDLRKDDADKALAELEKIEDEMKDMGINPQSFNKRKGISKRIRDLEMKIQTTGNLSPQEERELIEEIEKLTKRMDKLEVADEKRDEMRAIRKRLRTLRGEALSHHKEVQKLATLSQEYHDNMIDSIKDARNIRAEADTSHQEVIEVSKEINEIRKQISKISGEADKIRKQLGQETDAERKKRRIEEAQKREEELDTKAEDILERYQAGEKLGFEEFKLLISRGLLTEE
ncbi:MAG: coiled-coil protein [Candidatus Kariarchaeaceae archaeon]|jgi:uncharacterized coiled-coil DUF342 family protein